MFHIPQQKFEEILIKEGMVSKNELDASKEEATRTQRTLVNVLLGKGLISEEYLAETLAGYFRLETTKLEGIEDKKEIVKMIDEQFAKTNQFVVFDYDPKQRVMKIAMIDPGNLKIINFLEKKFNCKVIPFVTTPSYLKRAFKLYEKGFEEDFSKTINENIQRATSLSGEIDLSKIAQEVPIVTILNAIINNAANLEATDIHFEPLADFSLIRYRIDGILREILTLPKVIHPFLIARIKVLANLAIDEHRKPQDGRFRFSALGSDFDVRVSIMPVLNGEKAEMRLLRPPERPLSFSDLGMSPKDEKAVKEALKKTQGMILACGPTGCGKTTTLYACLGEINKPGVNIMTIEDPIEYSIPRINQIQVNPKAGITFASGLRSIVRQDPDVIMVGEIRDKETARIAVNAALTGHLVLSSVHTNDAPSAITRLLDMGIEHFFLEATLRVIIAQRLVRKICLSCIESYQITPEIKRLIEAQLALYNVQTSLPKIIYHGKGCKACGYTGYRGRTGIFEVLEVSPKIKKLILAKASAQEIRDEAIKEGMIPMFQDGLLKIGAGISTIDEVLRVVRI